MRGVGGRETADARARSATARPGNACSESVVAQSVSLPRKHAWRLAPVLLAVFTAAPPVAGADAEWLRRPLHLPRMAAGGRCPVGAGRLAASLARGLPHVPAAGVGPAYLLSVGGERAGVVSIAGSVRDAQGWRGQKAPWWADRRFGGPILIRGVRIDGHGPVAFARQTGQHLSALYERRGMGRQPNGWRAWPSALLVRTPGCFALQVDGTTFSETIVIRVRG